MRSVPQGSSITGTSPSDCFVSYQDTHWGWVYPSAEVQMVYSKASKTRQHIYLNIYIYIYIHHGTYSHTHARTYLSHGLKHMFLIFRIFVCFFKFKKKCSIIYFLSRLFDLAVKKLLLLTENTKRHVCTCLYLGFDCPRIKFKKYF